MISLLKKYVKNNIVSVIINTVIVIVTMYVQTVLCTRQMRNILTNGVYQKDYHYVITCVLLMLGYTVLAGVLTVLQVYFSATLTATITNEVREDLFNKILTLSVRDYAHFGAATLHTRVISGTSQIDILILNSLRNILRIPAVIIIISIEMLRINLKLALIFIFVFIATAAFLVVKGSRSRVLFNEQQKSLDKLNALSSELIIGARPVRATNNQEYEIEKLKVANEEVSHNAIIANNNIAFLAPTSLVVMNWVIILVYIVGSFQLKTKMTSIADLITILSYMSTLVSTLTIIPLWIKLLPKASVACGRINEVLKYETDLKKSKGEKEGINKGEVEFKDVVFGYNDERFVLDHVSFKAEAGKLTAIVGATGSGKTTVLNVIDRLYEIKSGDILIDGKPLSDYDESYLRSKISYATQKAYVFNTSVTNNITAYQELDNDRLDNALKSSCFDSVVPLLEKGMDTKMAQGGSNISGGQRQRLSLARCLYKKASIYLLDDTYSALDASTETKATAETKKLLKGKTTIIVAEKLHTIMDADKIILMEDGKIIAEGKHEDLLTSCDEYREIYNTQEYAKEESAHE